MIDADIKHNNIGTFLEKGDRKNIRQEEERGRKKDRPFSSYHWSGNATKLIQTFDNSPSKSTVILNSLTSEQIECYSILIRIDEICNMLNNGNFIPDDDRLRSPSPPPVYDAHGRRKNTREYRYKKKFENERCLLIERIIKLIPDFKKPEWYKPRPTKITEKLYIKTKEYPDINFIGLLIGPRGNTLKKLQEDSGAKIGIRGKGSVKEGKNLMNITPDLNNLQDQLHCLITADSIEKVELAKKLCQKIMDKAIFSPVGQNDLKRDQLRELAKLNGTFRDSANKPCIKCGEIGHNKNECKLNKPNFVNSLICSKCGNIGHLEKDCKLDNSNSGQNNDKMDEEFENFLNDVNNDNDDNSNNDNEIKTNHTEEAQNAGIKRTSEMMDANQYEPNGYKKPYYGSTAKFNSYTEQYNQYKGNHNNYQNYNNYNNYNNRNYNNYNSGGYGGYNQYNHQYKNYNNYNSYNNYNNNGVYELGYNQHQQYHRGEIHNNVNPAISTSYSKSVNPFDKSNRIDNGNNLSKLPPGPPSISGPPGPPGPPPISKHVGNSNKKINLPPPPPPSTSTHISSTKGVNSMKKPSKFPPPPPPPPTSSSN